MGCGRAAKGRGRSRIAVQPIRGAAFARILMPQAAMCCSGAPRANPERAWSFGKCGNGPDPGERVCGGGMETC
jgi:hypothetical protein